MIRRVLLGLLVLTAVALALRCPQLSRRPMHNDEAVNACKFGELWEQGTYKYDPFEYHGPTLHYFTLALSKATQAPRFADFDEARLRWVTVLAGVGLIWLLPLIIDGIGRWAAFWSGLLVAISPAMVFYSRYFIHEMLLVFFTFLALGAGWRYTRTQKIGWALLAGLGVGMMAATKETFVIPIAAAVGALILNSLFSGPEGLVQKIRVSSRRLLLFKRWTHLIAALGVCLAVAVLFFSSFFSNSQGILDAIRTYLPWLHRAGGASPHIHPWYWYFERLTFFHRATGPYWSEALILLLAVAGFCAAFSRREVPGMNRSLIRFLAFYTILLTLAYCAISYKTPWCLLGFWHGFILLAGVGIVFLGHWIKKRAVAMVLFILLIMGMGRLAAQAWMAGTIYCEDRRNPYVYSPTSTGIFELIQKIEAIAAVDPQHEGMVLKVMAPHDDYWPLPWYLRRFTHIGWWNNIPADPYAPVMIVSADMKAALDDKKTHVMVGMFEQRREVLFELYVEKTLWENYLKNRPRPAKLEEE